uniref:Saccharopine dehydrogenase NADP binding domain-containing protein n=1 Tax=Rhodosorus marinus TaxID=101924 RepID=A0A7S3EDD8_9RHOD|mmetsp:Transcript_27672/g.108523  ORF Transcript_27672/g.108523 Transcript_27672/m.108523 type:complete len:415 (+) Transcript_27672:631-1875(+)
MTMGEFDILLLGVTGCVGKLAAAELISHFGEEIRLGFGGRNVGKTEAVRAALAAQYPSALKVPIVQVDTANREVLAAIVRRSKVVLNLVGPYTAVGEAVVRACAEGGVDYCDVSGEGLWQHEMIGRYHDTAMETGARLVFGLGIASAASDLSAFVMAQYMHEKHNVKLSQVHMVWTKFEAAGASGGTVSTLMAEGERSSSERHLLRDPYLLHPAGSRAHLPGQNRQTTPLFDVDSDRYTIPWISSDVNTQNVLRSYALLDYSYGRAFTYYESFAGSMGNGFFNGLIPAMIMHFLLGLLFLFLRLGLTRPLMRALLPKPGEEPSAEALDKGCVEGLITAHGEKGCYQVTGRLTIPFEPGYKFTSISVSEASVLLAKAEEHDLIKAKRGCLTAASCFEALLVEKLLSRGIKWEILD